MALMTIRLRCNPETGKKDIVISLEIPMRSLADQGVGARERLAPCVAAARSLLNGRQT